MKIAIVGSGVLGLATGMGFVATGQNVVYCDSSPTTRKTLAEAGHTVVESVADVGDCDVYMICVPTPASNGGFDLNSVKAAVEDVARELTQGRVVTVVVRSTLMPGTARSVVLPALEKFSGLQLGKHFGLAYNPEFLRAASALDDFMHPPLTVIGEFDPSSADLLAELYQPFGADILRTTPENAEAIKCFSNAFNALKVSFFNLLFLAGQRAGFAPSTVAQGMQRASLGLRIPSYYTEGGYPYGGTCLPKDLSACISLLDYHGLDASLLTAVADVNHVMTKHVDVTTSATG